MCVQMLPFFKCLVVKCGERGTFEYPYPSLHALTLQPFYHYITGVFIAQQITPSTSSHRAWLTLPPTSSPSKPLVLPTSTPGTLIIFRWYPALKLDNPVVNVTGAGDSLVGSLLGSLTHAKNIGEVEGIFDHPERMDRAIERAQRAAGLSLQSEFAVSPRVSEMV